MASDQTTPDPLKAEVLPPVPDDSDDDFPPPPPPEDPSLRKVTEHPSGETPVKRKPTASDIPTIPSRASGDGSSTSPSLRSPTKVRVPPTPSFESKDSKTPNTFAANMTHNFDVVSKQVESGLYATKRVAQVLRKIAQYEDEFAKNVLRVLGHEGTKLGRLNEDGMRGFTRRWLESLSIVKELALSHQRNAATIMSDIVVPLAAFNAEADNQKKNYMANERKVSQDMALAADRVRKGYQMCSKLINQCRDGQENKKKMDEKDKNVQSRSRTSVLMSSIKKKATKYAEKFTGTIEDLQHKTYVMAVQYQQDIESANKRQATYLKEDLPHVFDCMQKLETKRLDMLKKHLTRYTQQQEKTLKQQVELTERMRGKVKELDTASDITNFISDWVEEHGPPVPVPAFQYSLSSLPDDIKIGRLTGNPNSVFRTTLYRCMEIQKDAYPDLEIPRIVSVMVKAIRDLNGPKTEGIFRISAELGELEKFRERVENGNYDLKGIDNPHLPAALLKTWLRLLADPLIPDHLYTEAIDIAKDQVSTPKEIQVNIGNLWSKLDELNQGVVQALGSLCLEIASPENSAINRMTLNTLAIVFSPSFLRNNSDDPSDLLQNTKYETRFVVLLLEFLGKSAPESEKAVVSFQPRRTVDTTAAAAALLSDTSDSDAAKPGMKDVSPFFDDDD